MSTDVKTARRRDQLSHHIGFAERWLTRAKGEVARGDLGRGQLTLLLAEAEIHHARAAEGAPATAPRPHPVTMIVGTTLLAAALLSGLAAALPRSTVTSVLPSSPPMIRFKQPVGSTLALIPMVAAPQTPTQMLSAPARGPALAGAPRAAPRRSPVRTAVPSRPVSIPAPPLPAAAPLVLVSDGDLIDLVLAAERSLRGEKR
ncbi:MAG TPA: hypothetical protein VGR25_05510 [bacterium]|nr:hypothetical protein [bacterium]